MNGHRGADPYLPHHGDLSFSVSHYDLQLDYRVEGNHLTGRALLDCVALEDLEHLHLDLLGLKVDKVTVAGTRAKHSHTRGVLKVRMPAPVAAGTELVVAVHYSGHPGPHSARHLGDAGWEELTDGAIVAGQPHGAPTWFPVNDRPSDKATYRISVTAPSDYTVVANGTLVTTSHGSSTTTWVFDEPDPMAPYLATVHVGRYRVRDLDATVPLRAAVPPSRGEEFAEAFAEQAAMIETFVELFGPYPFDAYTVVVTDDDLEIPLESQSLSTFGANHLVTDWDAERLIAHELSHQWFGNSLTAETWRDIWLHEGFACYSEWLWSEHSGGDSADDWARHHWDRLSELDQDLVLGDPGPELMFDDRVYKRGALLLHALRLELGDEAFFEVLRSWVSQHAHGTVTTDLFAEHLAQETDLDVDDLLEAWLAQELLPELPSAG
ncbi:M1 family metallopeptidase [Nocardioides korecus]